MLGPVFYVINLRTALFSTTVVASTTSLSTISLDQFGLKTYNFEDVHKFNIMVSLLQKLNLLSRKLQGSHDVSFFIILYVLALLDYSSSMMLLMTFRMCKILLKSPQFTIMCRCGRAF